MYVNTQCLHTHTHSRHTHATTGRPGSQSRACVSTNILVDDVVVVLFDANVDADADVDVVWECCRLLAGLLNRFAIFLHVYPAICTIWQPNAKGSRKHARIRLPTRIQAMTVALPPSMCVEEGREWVSHSLPDTQTGCQAASQADMFSLCRLATFYCYSICQNRVDKVQTSPTRSRQTRNPQASRV